MRGTFKKLLDRHRNIEGKEGYRSRAGGSDELNLATCLPQTSWAKRAVFLCSIFKLLSLLPNGRKEKKE